MTTPSRTAPRGTTLLEAMIALSILLIGLVGMFQLQIWGLGANQGARARTQALEVAKELAAALERVPFDNALLAPTVTGPSVPTSFGKALLPDGTIDPSYFRDWTDTDTTTLPNVRLDSTFDQDLVDPSLPAFQRRWAVWAPGGMAAPYTRMVAVSVVYRERTFQRAQEVTLLTQVSNVGASLANIAAYR